MGRLRSLGLSPPQTVTALAELVALLGQLERARTSVMALARGGREQEPWILYPGEYGIFDRRTQSHFYYHAHAGADYEAGHFHTALLFPDHAVHLVAISMAESGWPQALFAVNSWLVGDTYEPAENLKRYARRFHIGPGRDRAPLIRFVNLMFRAFIEEIERLQDEKDEGLQAYRAAHPGQDPLQDRSFEILSWVKIDVRAALARAVTPL